MAERLIIHLDFLNKVLKKRSLIAIATDKEVSILVEIIANLMKTKYVPLGKVELATLKPKIGLLARISKCRDVDVARNLLFKLKKSELKSIIIPALIATKLK